jgi:protein disulfide-isomerase-like protein
MMKVLAVCALLVAVVAAAGVVKLDSNNFATIVEDPTKDVFVKFFAPWCGHCTRMAPAWEELAKSQADNQDVVIAELDADAHRDAASKYGIRGFPTIKLFSKTNKAGKDYQGARDAASFGNFLKANL